MKLAARNHPRHGHAIDHEETGQIGLVTNLDSFARRVGLATDVDRPKTKRGSLFAHEQRDRRQRRHRIARDERTLRRTLHLVR
jgi:hypothetical protein